MGREKSLVYQVRDQLDAMAAYGESRHRAKKAGEAAGKIFSFRSMQTYKKLCERFVKWCREHFRRETGGKLRTLEDCRPHASDYLRAKQEEGCTAATLKTMRAALRKLYQDPKLCEDVKIDDMRRRDVVRSRESVGMDKHFSESRNAALVAFCRATGLRRHELEALRRDNPLRRDEDGTYWLCEIHGKGGRVRDVRILDPAVVLPLMDGSGGKVFEKVHAAADVHGYRREYAQMLYAQLARDTGTLRGRERYWCRGEAKGMCFDRDAARQVSQSLGHNRENVTVDRYLI